MVKCQRGQRQFRYDHQPGLEIVSLFFCELLKRVGLRWTVSVVNDALSNEVIVLPVQQDLKLDWDLTVDVLESNLASRQKIEDQ